MSSTFPRWRDDTVPPFVFLLIKELAANNIEMIVLAPHYPKAKFIETIDGIRIYRFPYFFPFSLQKLCYDGGIMSNIGKSHMAKIQVPFFLLMELIYCAFLTISKSPHIIHAHWAIPQGLVAAILKVLIKVPLITTIHGSDIFIFRKGRIGQKLIQFITAKSSIVTVNSTASLKALNDVAPQSKNSLIPMGIDLNTFNPEQRSDNLCRNLGITKYCLLCVGRLVPLKGFTFVIDALSEIVKQEPETKLIIVGDGPEKSNLQKQASDKGLVSNVIFTGNLSNRDLPQYYASSDIFIGPSITTSDGATEAFGVVFLEALASGTAVITTGSGGISDIIKNEKTGLIVPENNSTKIAQAVLRIIKDRQLKERLRNNGLEKVRENYTWSAIAQIFFRLYDQI